MRCNKGGKHTPSIRDFYGLLTRSSASSSYPLRLLFLTPLPYSFLFSTLVCVPSTSHSLRINPTRTIRKERYCAFRENIFGICERSPMSLGFISHEERQCIFIRRTKSPPSPPYIRSSIKAVTWASSVWWLFPSWWGHAHLNQSSKGKEGGVRSQGTSPDTCFSFARLRRWCVFQHAMLHPRGWCWRKGSLRPGSLSKSAPRLLWDAILTVLNPTCYWVPFS